MAFVTEYPDECTRCLKTKQDIQPGNGILGIVTLEVSDQFLTSSVTL